MIIAKPLRIAAPLVLLLAGGGALAQDFPQRKAGLWEVRMTMEGRAAIPGGATQQCVDSRTDAEMMKRGLSDETSRRECDPAKFRRTAGGWEGDTVCRRDGGVTRSHLVMSGDFSSSYTVDVTSTTEPPRNGMGPIKMRLVARHVGACPADMQPGQIRVAGQTVTPGAAAPGGAMPVDAAKLRQLPPEERRKRIEQMLKTAPPPQTR